MDVTVLPKNGAKSHIHSREDEVFYVIDGQFDLQYGENSIRATNGFHLFMKRGIPHSFKNIGNNEGKILIMFIPAGCEKLYEELGIPVTDSQGICTALYLSQLCKDISITTKIWY